MPKFTGSRQRMRWHAGVHAPHVLWLRHQNPKTSEVVRSTVTWAPSGRNCLWSGDLDGILFRLSDVRQKNLWLVILLMGWTYWSVEVRFREASAILFLGWLYVFKIDRGKLWARIEGDSDLVADVFGDRRCLIFCALVRFIFACLERELCRYFCFF